MFGYILPEKSELKVREYEMFRAFYCGVCKSIGCRHGQIPRTVLNYDCTFLALLLSSISDTNIKLRQERCIAHPASKRHIIRESDIINYASDMNVILAYYQLSDKWKDDRSAAAVSAMLLIKPSFKKLKRKYKEKCVIIEQRLNELSDIEKSNVDSMDMAAEPFAKLMEEIMAYEPLCRIENREKALKWIGYNIGKWIYILDAYDDIEKDIKRKAYNPFLRKYAYDGGNIEEYKNKFKSEVEFTLTYSLGQIAKAYELLEKKDNAAIVENIIYMGMLRKTENILSKGSCSKIEKSI